ncbi:MAG: hypothetical protein ABIQ18_07345, partial [Umezawaea sp.]
FVPTHASTVQYANAAPRTRTSTVRRVALITAAVIAAAVVFTGGIYTNKFLSTTSNTSAGRTSAAPTLTYGETGDIPVFEIYKGYCSNAKFQKAEQFNSAKQVDKCTGHYTQVITDNETLGAKKDLAYPGVVALTAFAESYCSMVFDSGRIAYDKSKLTYGALVPTSRSWQQTSGDRKIYCLVWLTNGDKLTKSVIVEES